MRHDGKLEVNGQVFDTPSGAGKHVKGAVTNGWAFWRVEDGRKLADVRAVYRGQKPESKSSAPPFNWSRLHAILEALPEGRWTTYGDLADAVGAATQPLGGHIADCPQCANAHRILNHHARVAPNFTWTDRADQRDPEQMLQSGTTSPALVRWRAMLEPDTTVWWCWSRCQEMISGPASRPASQGSSRSRKISFTVTGGNARGVVFGRRDRGSNAASPTAR